MENDSDKEDRLKGLKLAMEELAREAQIPRFLPGHDQPNFSLPANVFPINDQRQVINEIVIRNKSQQEVRVVSNNTLNVPDELVTEALKKRGDFLTDCLTNVLLNGESPAQHTGNNEPPATLDYETFSRMVKKFTAEFVGFTMHPSWFNFFEKHNRINESGLGCIIDDPVLGHDQQVIPNFCIPNQPCPIVKWTSRTQMMKFIRRKELEQSGRKLYRIPEIAAQIKALFQREKRAKCFIVAPVMIWQELRRLLRKLGRDSQSGFIQRSPYSFIKHIPPTNPQMMLGNYMDKTIIVVGESYILHNAELNHAVRYGEIFGAKILYGDWS